MDKIIHALLSLPMNTGEPGPNATLQFASQNVQAHGEYRWCWSGRLVLSREALDSNLALLVDRVGDRLWAFEVPKNHEAQEVAVNVHIRCASGV